MTLEALNIPTDDEITAARLWLRARARFLVGGFTGRGKLEPPYADYCEGRDGPGPKEWTHYSSCGDLPQGLAFELGCRLRFVNRKQHEGWRPGRNLLDFYAGQDAPARLSDDVPGVGDFCFIWSDAGRDAHAFVAGNTVSLSDGLSPGLVLETFNFGAGGMSPHEAPGAHQSNVKLRDSWQVTLKSGVVSVVQTPKGFSRTLGSNEKSQRKLPGLWIGSRRLRYVLEVPRLLELCDPDLLPNMTGEMLDVLEAEANKFA